MTRPLIGLSGRKRVGKDSFAAELRRKYGYTRVALADPVRELALIVNPEVIDDLSDWRAPLAEIVATYGWEHAKETPAVRQLLKDIGTGAREIFGEDCWIKLAQQKMGEWPKLPIVVTDIRFDNEAEWIRELGGIVVKINRPAEEGALFDTHVSEAGVDDSLVDIELENSGTLKDLLWWATVVHQMAAGELSEVAS